MEDAIYFYTRSIAIQPRSSILFSNRALAYSKKQMYDACISDCDEALRLDPSNVKAMMRRCRAYLKLNQRACALEDAICAMTLDPENEEIQRLHRQCRSNPAASTPSESLDNSTQSSKTNQHSLSVNENLPIYSGTPTQHRSISSTRPPQKPRLAIVEVENDIMGDEDESDISSDEEDTLGSMVKEKVTLLN